MDILAKIAEQRIREAMERDKDAYKYLHDKEIELIR